MCKYKNISAIKEDLAAEGVALSNKARGYKNRIECDFAFSFEGINALMDKALNTPGRWSSLRKQELDLYATTRGGKPAMAIYDYIYHICWGACAYVTRSSCRVYIETCISGFIYELSANADGSTHCVFYGPTRAFLEQNLLLPQMLRTSPVEGSVLVWFDYEDGTVDVMDGEAYKVFKNRPWLKF